jgi:hypothetical protein
MRAIIEDENADDGVKLRVSVDLCGWWLMPGSSNVYFILATYRNKLLHQNFMQCLTRRPVL